MSGTVVVGGGIAGLAVGHALLRHGVEVMVLEAASRAGGVLATHLEHGYLCESAANGWPEGESGGVHDLARALGVDLVPVAKAARRRFVFRHGALRAVPMSPLALVTTDLLSFSGKLRLLAEPLLPRGTAEAESVADFFRRRMGAEATAALADPFTTGVFAGDAETLELQSAFPRLAALEAEHGSLFLGMLARAARKRALWAPRKGVGSFVEALAGALGPCLRTNASVKALSFAPSGVRVTLDAGSLLADRVVLAVPAPDAAALLLPHDAELAGALRQIRYVGLVVVHVGLLGREVTHPLDGFGFLVARNEELRCLGCAFESSLWPDRAPKGQVLVRMFYGGARDPDAVVLTEDELAAVVVRDLRRVGITGAPPTYLRIVRHARAIPQYTIGHRQRLAAMETRAAALGVYLAGNPYHGVSLDDLARAGSRLVSANKRMSY